LTNNLSIFNPKNVTKLSDIWAWDPVSEIRDPGSDIRDPEKELIPDPGVKKPRIRGSKRHRIPDPDPQHCFNVI
jgi:hypothetical protein